MLSSSRPLNLLFLLDTLLAAFETIEQFQTSSDISPAILVSEQTLSQKAGILDKLCFYSDLLLQRPEERQPSMIAEEIRSYALRFSSQDAPSFCHAMFEKLRTLFIALSPLFSILRTNENVLMYLIEKRALFNHFLGERAIEHLLRTLFPLGLEELRLTLSDGYAKRGFEEFFARQKPLLDELEWETPCDPLLQTR